MTDAPPRRSRRDRLELLQQQRRREIAARVDAEVSAFVKRIVAVTDAPPPTAITATQSTGRSRRSAEPARSRIGSTARVSTTCSQKTISVADMLVARWRRKKTSVAHREAATATIAVPMAVLEPGRARSVGAGGEGGALTPRSFARNCRAGTRTPTTRARIWRAANYTTRQGRSPSIGGPPADMRAPSSCAPRIPKNMGDVSPRAWSMNWSLRCTQRLTARCEALDCTNGVKRPVGSGNTAPRGERNGHA